ncbi:MAG: IS4 family transposase [Albidovulum sp.]|nr:IS4 family transposase [Albidovulum sp.]
MEKQNLIRRTQSSPAGFERLPAILEGEAFENRSATVRRRVCDAFGFLDARGRSRDSSCLSVLAAMERGEKVYFRRRRSASAPPARRCSGARIQRTAAINAVIAWRLAPPAMCGRETPELDAKFFFTDIEIAVLADFAAERRLPGPDNLGRTMGLVAAIGGHLHRKHDRPPEYEIVWLGYARLADSSASTERAVRLGPESEVYKLLRCD